MRRVNRLLAIHRMDDVSVRSAFRILTNADALVRGGQTFYRRGKCVVEFILLKL